MKFGGTSVGSIERIRNVAKIVEKIHQEHHKQYCTYDYVAPSILNRIRQFVPIFLNSLYEE